jgi:hypothetical protein
MRTKTVLLAIVVAATTLCSVTPAHADWVWRPRPPDPYARRHFYIGGSGVGAAVINQTGPEGFIGNGGGFSLILGARLSRHFALEFGWEPTFHNTSQDAAIYLFQNPNHTVGINALTLDGKVYFAQGFVQPYFMFGGGAYLLGDQLHAVAEGPGYQLGGGIDFWLNPWFTIGGKVQYRGVEFIDYNARNDNTYVSMITAAGDFTAHF